MVWQEITIDTAPGGIEELAAALTAGGFADFVLEDQTEFEEFLEENRAYWDYIDEDLQAQMQGVSRIKLYLEEGDTQTLQKLEQLVAALKEAKAGQLGSLNITCTPLPDVDWLESWKENYPPQPVGKSLLVLPYWLAEEDTGGRLPVILDPGLTFGTGAHPSTQMVMEVMEETLPAGACCLDLGSGSGILSICALRLGAKSAIGVDIDPKAQDIALSNAAYNGFTPPRFTALTGNVTQDKKQMALLGQSRYDMVFVNIVADVIIGLSPALPQFLDADSLLVCSGILDTRLEEVIAALEQTGLTVTQVRAKEEWRCVCAKRRV
jgi:ribosomal protein L11 methyltransferase